MPRQGVIGQGVSLRAVVGKPLTVDELNALLERFALDRAGSRPAEAMTEAQIQHLLARATALTDALRDAEHSTAAQLASRLLLEDLAVIAAHFRGRANSMKPVLSKALADLADARATVGRERE